jgi:threonine dehydrogenase-like Zn-dependent dehydrogenase
MDAYRDDAMDALVWTGPHAMLVERIARPQAAVGEVLIAVGAAGICGSEISGYLGQSSIRRPPLVMGHEAAGTIVAADGAQFMDGSVAVAGQRVVINPLIVCGSCDRCRAGHENLCRQRQLIGAQRPGAFAPFVVAPAANCTPIPDTLSFEDALWTEPLACSLRAVRHAALPSDASLLVLGAGPIGLCCLAAARAMGIGRTIAADLSAQRLAAAEAWGATQTINAAERDLPAVLAALAPGGVDAAIDAVGAGVTRAQAVRAVVPGGRAVFIGLHDEDSPLEANYLVRQEITIVGSFAYSVADFADALELLVEQRLPHPASWLDMRPLSAGPGSFAELVRGSNVVKIALRPAL